MKNFRILPSVNNFPGEHHYYDFETGLEIKITVIGDDIITNYSVNKEQEKEIKKYLLKRQINNQILNSL